MSQLLEVHVKELEKFQAIGENALEEARSKAEEEYQDGCDLRFRVYRTVFKKEIIECEKELVIVSEQNISNLKNKNIHDNYSEKKKRRKVNDGNAYQL